MTKPESRKTRIAIAVCVVMAVCELAAVASMIEDWAALLPALLLPVAFLLGPPAFLMLIAWRRRGHEQRSALVLGLTLIVAAVGLGILGYDAYCYRTDAAFRLRGHNDVVWVPLGQWAGVLLVWLLLVCQEEREKKRKQRAELEANTSVT